MYGIRARLRDLHADPELPGRSGEAGQGPVPDHPSGRLRPVESHVVLDADGSKLIVANLRATLLERINYDRETDTFTFDKVATLDLVGGRT